MSPVLEPGTLDFISHSEGQTHRLGEKLGHLAQGGEIICLSGQLGMGKTRFAQGFGLGLGVPEDEVINSPTFTFVNQYQGRATMQHIDLYRLATAHEAETIGLEDLFAPENVCLIEWANRLGDELPAERLDITFHFLEDTKRRMVMQAYGPLHCQLLADFKLAAFGPPP